MVVVGVEVVGVEADVAPADVVVVVDEPDGTLPGVAVSDGENVATNGVRKDVGSTTGTPSTWRVRAGVPNWTVVVPLAATTWTVPAESAPAHTVVPVAPDPTWTQHDPVPVMVIWKVEWGTEYVAEVPADDVVVATNWTGKVVGGGLGVGAGLEVVVVEPELVGRVIVVAWACDEWCDL